MKGIFFSNIVVLKKIIWASILIFLIGCVSTQGPDMQSALDEREKWTVSEQKTKTYDDDEVKLYYTKTRDLDDYKRVVKLEIIDEKSKKKTVKTYQYFSNNSSSKFFSKPYVTMHEISSLDKSKSDQNLKEEWKYEKFNIQIGKIEVVKKEEVKPSKRKQIKGKKNSPKDDSEVNKSDQLLVESEVVVQTYYAYSRNDILQEKNIRIYKLITPYALRIVSDVNNSPVNMNKNYSYEFEYEALGIYAAPVSFKSDGVVICQLSWKRFNGVENYDVGYPEKHYSLRDWHINPLCCLILANPVISTISNMASKPELPGYNIRKRYFAWDDTFTVILNDNEKTNSDQKDRLLLNVNDIYLTKIYIKGSYETTYEWKVNKNRALLTNLTESFFSDGKMVKMLHGAIEYDSNNRRTREEWFRVDEVKKIETSVFREELKY